VICNVGMFLCDMQYWDVSILGCFFLFDLFLVITKFRLVVMVIYPNIPHIYSKMTMLGCFFVICNIGMFLCDEI